MNYKELINSVSLKMNLPKQDVEEMMQLFTTNLSDRLNDGDTIDFPSFGTFRVVKKEEKISQDPITKTKTLIPPKLVVKYKQSSILKQKINSKP